jgi:hypothetical protein
MNGLRVAMQALRDMKCPDCGKRIAVMATGWKGRGTGQRGASHYNATSFEARDPATHCTCKQTLNTDLSMPWLRFELQLCNDCASALAHGRAISIRAAEMQGNVRCEHLPVRQQEIKRPMGAPPEEDTK